MQAVVIGRSGGPEVVKLAEVPNPVAGPGQVVIELRAAALNRRDVWIRLGKYPNCRYPFQPGSDGAGIVAETGPEVSGIKKGAEVVIYPAMNWGDDERIPGADFKILGMPDPGTCAGRVAVPVGNVFPKPKTLSWEEAAAFPLASLTAYRALVTRAKVKSGEWVFIPGIGGGVATFALLLARNFGARVAASSSSDEKLAKAKELGAEVLINYTDADWEKQLVERTGGGPNVIIDGVGEATVARGIRALRPAGRLVIYGITSGGAVEHDPRLLAHIYWKQLDVLGSTMGSPREFSKMLKERERLHLS